MEERLKKCNRRIFNCLISALTLELRVHVGDVYRWLWQLTGIAAYPFVILSPESSQIEHL